MAYNLTGFANSTNVFSMYSAIDSTTGNLLSSMTLIVVFVSMMFIMMRSNPATESIVASSALCMVISLIFIAMEVLSVVWLAGFTTILAFSAIALYLNRQ